MRHSRFVIALLLGCTPALGAAQETPRTPPAADSLRPVPRMRARPHPVAPLLTPRLQRELQLSEQQVQRLDAIRDEVRTQERARQRAWRAERQRMREEERAARERARERMHAVLTDAQRQKLEELRRQRPGRLPPR